MPLEYVTSNAGYPMLVVDRYTFHRHSSNPKTGRTNWRCSRRRVKDIRCASSCHTVDDMASTPTAHDPNCLPLTNAELMAYQVRREKINNSQSFKLHESSNHVEEENTSNGFNYTTDNFQNREIGSDEEELNDVLQDLNENVINEDDNNLGENHHDSNLNSDYNTNKDSGFNNDESLDSSVQDSGIEANNTISGIIECNKKLLSNINNNKLFGRHQNIHSVNTSPLKANPTLKLPITSSVANGGDNKSIYFVTSKVGHPMLVVDQYTFHKHSMNPKTGRINWRCARRRVKEIRCSSSCYTVDGVVSNPTQHDQKCLPLTEELLKAYQNKRAKLSANNYISSKVNNFMPMKTINMKAESYTTLKAKAINNNNQSSDYNGDNEYENNDTYRFEEFNSMVNDVSESDLNYERTSPVPKFQQLYRNKRKENMPTRSSENSDEYNSDNLTITNLIDDNQNHQVCQDGDMIDQNEEDNYFENEDLGYNEEHFNYENGENGEQNFNDSNHHEKSDIDSYEDIDQSDYVNGDHDDLKITGATNDYLNEANCSTSPDSISRMINDLNELRRREKIYSEKLRNANSEMNRIKRLTSKQIQSLHWKSKMMEIDMSSLKSSIQQKNMENQNLKRLVDDMMTKLRSDLK